MFRNSNDVATPTAEAPARVVIDTDPGIGAPGADIDDGFAILYALAAPEIDLLGLTIVNGNATLEAGCSSASALLSRLGDSTTPVHAGADEPLLRDMAEIRSSFAHVLPTAGQQFASAVDRPLEGRDAPAWIVRQVLDNPHQVTVAAIGPMTNLARALQIEPAIAGLAKEFVLMAGSATTLAQNMTPVAEFNTYVDPEAMAIVLDSGAAIRMVGADQTYRVTLNRDDVARLRTRGSELSLWLAACVEAWIDFNARVYPHRPDHREVAFMHDPLALTAITHPHLLTWEPAHVQVETTPGLTYGMVVADRGLAVEPMGDPNCLVAVDTDVTAFRQVFMDRLMSLV